MDINIKSKMIVKTENDYLEFEDGDQISITLKSGKVIVATIEKFTDAVLTVLDDESDTGEYLEILFEDIEEVYEG
jgi:small nuclear ribonucleoprotein (snRNP)-like protein